MNSDQTVGSVVSMGDTLLEGDPSILVSVLLGKVASITEDSLKMKTLPLSF